MTDARTLRLAHPDVSPEQVEAFIRYQRTMLKALMETSGDDWAGRFAFGHARALKASGLDPLDQRRIASAAESFCGRRWAARTVTDRLAEARARVEEARARGAEAPAREISLIEKAPEELKHLEDLSELEEVLGPATMASLKSREAELLELHRSVAAAEGRGHVHFKGIS
jgi:hypothetical protein